ncbi:hypothetical protein [uncultured Hyphomonas sp.]|uniref:hypothetical protein n=1 Tax=uncultured Hyphomonas sp. TaxID=225298 RepID=UPI002AAAB8FE|nr:hypothetical protein [uncultured Hyphomonas sp.]
MEATRSGTNLDVSSRGLTSPVGKMKLTLRERLRTGTRADHDRLDGLAGRLSFARYEDLLVFIRANCLAYRSLMAAAGHAEPMLAQRLDRAGDVLGALGTSLMDDALEVDTSGIEPIGLSYVVAGSSLGARLIAQQSEASADPRVRVLAELLLDPELDRRWRDLAGELRNMTGQGEQAEEIVTSAANCFRVFQQAFEHVLGSAGARYDVR